MRRAALLVLGWVLWGCGDLDPVHEGRPISLTVRPGTRVSSSDDWVHGDGHWAPAGDRVYYVAVSTGGGRFYVAGVRAGGGGRAVVDLGQAMPALGSEGGLGRPGLLRTVAPLPDGGMLCAAWTDTVETAVRGILRWSTSDGIRWLPGVRDAVALALAADPRYLVYRTGDGVLHGYDLTAGGGHRIGPGDPFAFAPGAPELLYRTDAGAWAVASLADGSRRSIPLTLDANEGSAVDAHWGPEGIRLLTMVVGAGRSATTFAVVDAGSGVRTAVYESPFEGAPTAVQWLPDGRRMAMWQSVFTDPCTLSSGCEPHGALYLVDMAGGSETWIAGVRGILGSRLAYAPGGRRAVYTAGGVLYVLALP